jgi:WD40 repeat protein
MAILVDGMVATGSSDNSIKIWNPKNGDLMKTLEGHRFPVRGLQVLANGNLASCGEDNLVIVWAA